jgi:uncharacterized protein YbjT (DUF2867 family)
MRDRLVTLIGGGGFVGRYVAQALLRAGARVRVAQRDPRQAYRIKPLGGLGQTQFVAADVTRPDTIARAVAGADTVVNLVGVLAGKFQQIHVDGARTVAEAAAAHGLEAMVHVSAIGADPESPSAYGRSKGEGEAAVRDAFPAATILRPSIVFGPEDRFLNRFAGMIARSPVVPVLKGGTRFQPVFAGDVGDAVNAVVQHPGAHAGRTYELGGPEVVTMAALHRWLADAIGRRPEIVELPDFVGAAIARAGFLPGAPITWDQWLMLGRDNVVTAEDGLAALGVQPTLMATVAPGWLVRFRRQGRFGRRLEDLA